MNPGTSLAMGLLGGLALFLFGLDQLTGALKIVAGDRMRAILARLTTNRFAGVLTGAFITSIIQSSSVTTVLVVGFVTAGLMSLSQSIGVIMGANIGTTVTAQIIAFKVTQYALALVAIGFAMLFLGKRERIGHYGRVLMGLGLVFYGMSVMGQAMEPLKESAIFAEALLRMEQPWLGILAGALFTALVQSSSATTGVVIVMASQGLITLEAGIALVFGSNIGTCITAMLAAIGKPREALRAAVVHVIFNVAGVLVWYAFIDRLAGLVTLISPQAPALSGATRLAAETPRQIANAHTIFNVTNTLLFVGLSSQFARFVERLVPDRPIEAEALVRARYLDVELLSTPSLALDRARMEILHLGDRTREMFEAIRAAMLTGTEEELDRVRAMDDGVDALHGQVITYLGTISQQALDEKQTAELVQLMRAANDLESIGDVIETNLVSLGQERVAAGFTISPATVQLILGFHQTIGKALAGSLQAVAQRNVKAARQVIEMKTEINRQADAATMHQAARLVVEAPHRLSAYTIETDILENLKRIYYFAKRISRAVASGKG